MTFKALPSPAPTRRHFLSESAQILDNVPQFSECQDLTDRGHGRLRFDSLLDLGDRNLSHFSVRRAENQRRLRFRSDGSADHFSVIQNDGHCPVAFGQFRVRVNQRFEQKSTVALRTFGDFGQVRSGISAKTVDLVASQTLSLPVSGEMDLPCAALPPRNAGLKMVSGLSAEFSFSISR